MSTSSDEDVAAIVFDIGSHCARVNFAGEDAPNIIVNSLDYPDYTKIYSGSSEPEDNPIFLKDHIGEFDIEMKEKIISFCYDKLSVHPEEVQKESPVLFTEHMNNCPRDREKLAELMFERFVVPGFYTAKSPLLSLYSSGRGCGIVIESGHSATETIVVYEGYVFENSIFHENIGGATVTKAISLESPGLTPGQCNNLKEQCASFSDSNHDKAKTYELPDGAIYEVNQDLLDRSINLLFGPGKNSLHQMAYKIIMASNILCRKDIFANIVLSGGNTLISGFPESFQNHLECLVKKNHDGLKVKVIAAPERKYNPWIGGSILASLCYMQSMWVSKQQYDENGVDAVHTMCGSI